nr:hypothetical protein [Tanacetum cinerariifolium]
KRMGSPRSVEKLEKRNRSRNHKLKRLYKVGLTNRVESSRDEESLGEDASKQGRRIDAIDQDEDITLVNIQNDAEMFDVNDLGGEEVFVVEQEVVSTATTITTKEISLAQALEALKTSKPKKEKNKRAGEELIRENTKKQKVEDDKETTELKQLTEIIPDKEEVATDAITLAVKSLRIVDWKIHKEGKKSYYQIVRADGKSQVYMVFSKMLEIFDREYLEDLYKLVKAKFKSTRPVEDLDLLLWGDLKTIF